MVGRQSSDCERAYRRTDGSSPFTAHERGHSEAYQWRSGRCTHTTLDSTNKADGHGVLRGSHRPAAAYRVRRSRDAPKSIVNCWGGPASTCTCARAVRGERIRTTEARGGNAVARIGRAGRLLWTEMMRAGLIQVQSHGESSLPSISSRSAS